MNTKPTDTAEVEEYGGKAALPDLFNYRRRETHKVAVGTKAIGGDSPVLVQSMATTDTCDIPASVEQAETVIRAGGELVRFTTQGSREAEALEGIVAGLRKDGFTEPVSADVHFNPAVAEVAAAYADKVRINPGNYIDPARTFKAVEYTEEEYSGELWKIRDRLSTLIGICREHGTALRIGVNHGSLSDRIRNRYGDTPEGIVESCMEFLRICKDMSFGNVVVSVKSSNTMLMVRAVRLMVETMAAEGMAYPLHLGVTEAGDGDDGRIKSAVGIGALLADGIGDTVRVSLSEPPENEIPVARHLVEYISSRSGHVHVQAEAYPGFDYSSPRRRATREVGGIGGNCPAAVVSSRLGGSSAFKADAVPDYVYVGGGLPEHRAPGVKYVVDFQNYKGEAGTYPIFPHTALAAVPLVKADVKFVALRYGCAPEEYTACLRRTPEAVAVCFSRHPNRLGEQRALVHEMARMGLDTPVVFVQAYAHRVGELPLLQIEAAADMGALMADGLVDGLWIMNDGGIPSEEIESTAFAVLQAGRLRISKTEYISCPGCGRTLFDLPATVARVKKATGHMKGLKIGVMGCIVNGPGEMADADYGYVGAARGKVSLYKGRECVKKNIPEEQAVEHLLELIQQDYK